MKSYELITTDYEDGARSILKATEGEREIWIPTDPANSDYAEYLRYTAWVDEGNNPEDFWKQEN